MAAAAAAAAAAGAAGAGEKKVEGGIDTALYDRQLRLWGEQGQLRLQAANVCLIGATATGTETLKNLVLPGVGRFTVIDGAEAGAADLGNNFFVTHEFAGKPRAEAAVACLAELNDTVQGTALVQDAAALVRGAGDDDSSDDDDDDLAAVFGAFTIVIVADWSLDDALLAKLAAFLARRRIPLVVARVDGFMASVRLAGPEHCIVEARPDNPPDDLRINCPWPELQAHADAIDLASLSSKDHSNVPYVILLIKIVQAWRAAHDGELPKTADEKDAFKKSIQKMNSGMEENFDEALKAAVRAYMPYELRDEVKTIFGHAECDPENVTADTPDFWVLAAAAKQFVDQHGTLPLPGSIPDMTAGTQGYMALQKLYADKAAKDSAAYTALVEALLTTRASRAKDAITPEAIKLFLRNVNVLQTVKFRSVGDELAEDPATTPEDFPIMFMVEDYAAVKVYWALRAVAAFNSKHGRLPGANPGPDADKEDDIAKLSTILRDTATQWGVADSITDEDVTYWATEMWRSGGAELHPIASFIGGITAQEAVKIISKQFTPLNNTFVYNGATSSSMIVRA